MRSITTQNKQITWTVDQGRLSVHAAGSPGTWFSAADTYSLVMLLLPEVEAIKRAYDRELAGASTTVDAVGALRRQMGYKHARELAEGATGVEGVEL